jgi:hypothetical protein
MVELVRISQTLDRPALVAFECRKCRYVTTVLQRPQAQQSRDGKA